MHPKYLRLFLSRHSLNISFNPFNRAIQWDIVGFTAADLILLLIVQGTVAIILLKEFL